MSKKKIQGVFSEEDVKNRLSARSKNKATQALDVPKHLILPHPGFPLRKAPNGRIVKEAYGKYYPSNTPDLEIDLLHISRYEKDLNKQHKRKDAKKHLKFHYKRAISILSPKVAAGWNRWSEGILELFISEKMHKVVWGSGNCGKSIVMAVLLYTKWRVNPSQRMVVIASKVVKDASARVFGYIKDIHLKAPTSKYHKFNLSDTAQNKAIYCRLYDENTGKTVNDERACIISLPVKTDARNEEIGANLLGKHPDDELIIAFDEAQELPASLAESRIFANWYTNKNIHIYAWGNPQTVFFHSPENYDMLFKLGADKLSKESLIKKQKSAEKTSSWGWHDTLVLHLAMTDSPRDDPDERFYKVKRSDGTEDIRLWFLAGEENVATIAQKISPNTPAWFSQVLGFPYITFDSSNHQGVLSAAQVQESRKYPLIWRTAKLQYFMGIDPSASGRNDEASIVVIRCGIMQDGRYGVDVMNGEGMISVAKKDDEEFTDSIIEAAWELAQRYGIPLHHVGADTHGTGEVFRYAMARHIENQDNPKWPGSADRGEHMFIVNPTAPPTDRPLFRLLGKELPAENMVNSISTEYWIAVRCMVLSRQIFNIPDKILRQFYSRQLMTQGVGNKYKLESKKDMRKRGLDSPNDADALCNAVEVMRRQGHFQYRMYTGSQYNNFFAQQQKQTGQMRADRARTIVSDMLNVNMGISRARIKKNGGVEPI